METATKVTYHYPIKKWVNQRSVADRIAPAKVKAKMAEHLGVSVPTLNNMVFSRCIWRLADYRVALICDFFGTTPEQFWAETVITPVE